MLLDAANRVRLVIASQCRNTGVAIRVSQRSHLKKVKRKTNATRRVNGSPHQ